MFNVKNLKIFFLALLLVCAMPVLCMAQGKKHHGTRVNVGAHADTGGGALRLIVQLVNPSDSTITITDIKFFRPDGTQVSPIFPPPPSLSFPGSIPFDLGPHEARGVVLMAGGIDPVNFSLTPNGVFQVHTEWESTRATSGLKSFSVVVTTNSFGVVSKISGDGFDLSGGN